RNNRVKSVPTHLRSARRSFQKLQTNAHTSASVNQNSTRNATPHQFSGRRQKNSRAIPSPLAIAILLSPGATLANGISPERNGRIDSIFDSVFKIFTTK